MPLPPTSPGLRGLACGLLLSLMACSSAPSGNTPAPIGELSVLEQLAKSYNEVMENVPGNPRDLPPAQRRQFVEQVFAQSGYAYSATLTSLGDRELDPFDDQQRDLARLLLLPLDGVATDQYDKYYDAREIQALHRIRKIFP